jgi:murein DD-endopeptidase MepM/ murein hydrolase activator NlpD
VKCRNHHLPLLLASALLLCAAQAPPPPAPAPAQQPAPQFLLSGSFRQGGIVRGVAPERTIGLTLDGKAVPVAADRSFIIGFDRDQGDKSTLVAELAEGSPVTRELRIAPRSWRIEHIDAARRPGGASEEYMRKRKVELARIEAARAKLSDAGGWRQFFILPSRGRISGVFGSQRVYRGEPASFHSGLDIAGGWGAEVVAPADGIVVLAGPPMFSLEGNLVIIDHGMGLNSAFLHLATTAVREGETVKQGQRIGTAGATGRATGPHLHWSVKWADARLDPQEFILPEAAK